LKNKKRKQLNRRIQMKKVLYGLLLTVFVLTLSVGSANAAWFTGFATAKKVLANADSTKLTSASAATAIVYILGAGETLNTNDVLVLTLTGGAKFSATAPTLTASGAGFTIVGSPTGLDAANFRVAEVQDVGSAITVNTNGTIFNVGALTGNVDVRLQATTSVGDLPIFNALQSSLTGAAFAFGSSAMESVQIVAKTDTADVSATTGAFTKFTGATLVGTPAVFDYKNLSEAANTVPNGQQISAGKVIFNISGTLSGITTISGTGCTGSNSAGTQGTGIANFFLIDTAKTNAYCFNTAAIVPQGTVLLAPTFTLDGTTAQAARGFNASVAVLDDGTKWDAHAALAATALYSITRNGSSFVTNSVGARNKIKITDRSGGIGTGGGAISVTARDADGNALTEVAGAPALTLLNNATTEILGTDLAARFTGTPMRYDFSVESSEIVVTNVKYNADQTMNVTTIFTTTASEGI
jgi:hypothetical protein